MFKKGDKVWSITYGWGVVVEISVEKNNVCPVCVEFKNFTTSFTLEGKSFVHGFRDLFFEEIPVPNSALKRPRKSAKEMLDECKEVKFRYGEYNWYVYVNLEEDKVFKGYYCHTFTYGVKHISKEDADRIVAECKENN